MIFLFPPRMNFDHRPFSIHYRETSRLSEYYYSPFIGRTGRAKLKFHLQKYTWRRIRNFANFLRTSQSTLTTASVSKFKMLNLSLFFYFYPRHFLLEKIPAFKESSLSNGTF